MIEDYFLCFRISSITDVYNYYQLLIAQRRSNIIFRIHYYPVIHLYIYLFFRYKYINEYLMVINEINIQTHTHTHTYVQTQIIIKGT